MAALPLSMTTEVICQEIKTLSMYMQFYLDHFLFRMSPNNSADGDSAAMPIDVVGRRLQEILGRITQLTVHLSSIRDYIYHAYSISESDINTRFHGPANDFLHFPDLQPSGLKSTTDPWERDTALALLYSLAQLIKEMMEPAADLNEEGIRHSAIAVCRLCASFPSDSLMALSLTKRSLFWAGLILTKSKYLDAHLWIKGKLHHCIRAARQLSPCEVIEDEENVVWEIMEQSDRRSSIRDIWTLVAGGVTVFHYNVTLATWFFGLNLVRFETTPRGGRSLQIVA